MQPLTFAYGSRCSGARGGAALAALVCGLSAPGLVCAQDSAATHSGGLASVSGNVVDSLHQEPLVNAEVQVEGMNRGARTDSGGNFRIDSIPPGMFRLGVFHPLLDSIGVGIASPPLMAKPGAALIVTLATPAGTTIAAMACRDVPAPVGNLATGLATGPTVVMGRVLDADSDEPVAHVAVTYTWTAVEASKETGFHKTRYTRQATTGTGGDFHLCHIPLGVQGSLRAARLDGGAAAAASNVSRDLSPHALLSLVTLHMPVLATPTIAALAATASAPDQSASSAAPVSGAPAASTPPQPVDKANTTAAPKSNGRTPPPRYATGAATVSGKVINLQALPVVGAKVYVVGAADSALTDRQGEFGLHNLPSGTRILVARAIGYEPVTQPVELSTRESKPVVVAFTARAAPTLAPVLITARLDAGLKRVGFDRRKKAGTGTYWTLPEIDAHKAYEFHDLFATFPGIRVDHTPDGRSSLMATRAAGGCIGYTGTGKTTVGKNCGPCLAFVVDGLPFDETQEGEMDEYLHPNDLGAVEVYQENEAPRSIPGVIKPDCTNIVIWTKAKLGV